MSLAADNIKPARLLLWIMKFVGLWTFPKNRFNPYYRSYSWTLHFFGTFLFILGMYIQVALSQNLDELSDALYISLTEIALFFKVLNLLLKSRQAVELITIFERFEEGTPKTSAENELLQKAHSGFVRLRNMHVGGSTLALLISFFPPLLEDNYKLPFPCWLPFDYKNPEKYFYAYGYIMFAMTVTCFSNYTIDLFQSYLLFHLSVYYDLLGNRLKNFGYNGNENDELLHQHFEFHATIASLTAEVQKFLSFPMLVQFILSAFVLCFTTYKLKNTSLTENPSVFIFFVVLAGIMSLQTYLPCKYGNQLTVSANELTNAIYASNWTNLPLKTKKKIFIYMEYLKQPVVVKAGLIFNIGLNVFSQTMNNAYRLYALLLNIET